MMGQTVGYRSEGTEMEGVRLWFYGFEPDICPNKLILVALLEIFEIPGFSGEKMPEFRPEDISPCGNDRLIGERYPNLGAPVHFSFKCIQFTNGFGINPEIN